MKNCVLQTDYLNFTGKYPSVTFEIGLAQLSGVDDR